MIDSISPIDSMNKLIMDDWRTKLLREAGSFKIGSWSSICEAWASVDYVYSTRLTPVEKDIFLAVTKQSVAGYVAERGGDAANIQDIYNRAKRKLLEDPIIRSGGVRGYVQSVKIERDAMWHDRIVTDGSLDAPIEVLLLPTRSYNALHRQGARTVRDVVSLINTKRLINLRGVGHNTLKEITDAVNKWKEDSHDEEVG